MPEAGTDAPENEPDFSIFDRGPTRRGVRARAASPESDPLRVLEVAAKRPAAARIEEHANRVAQH